MLYDRYNDVPIIISILMSLLFFWKFPIIKIMLPVNMIRSIADWYVKNIETTFKSMNSSKNPLFVV